MAFFRALLRPRDNVTPWMPQVLPLVGVIVGATIQFVFSRVGESAKAKATLRVQAYVDYIACLSDSAHLSLSRDKAEIMARATSAKTRISIYGSANVVTALADFEKAGAHIGSNGHRTAALALISAMRNESVGNKQKVSDETLRLVLFGEDRSVNTSTIHPES
jgi:hypothetical protein